MRKSTLLKIICVTAAFCMLPLSALGIHAINPTPNIVPHYLLTGQEKATSGNFVYYKIDGKSEYAIGLSASGKAATELGSLPTTYIDGTTPVTAIWRYGFSESKANSIVIGSNIKTIDFEAFMYASIQTMVIPDTVERLGEAAFYGCPGLRSVSFGVPEGGADDCNCTIPTDDSVNPHITKIPSYCFLNCSTLKNLSLPKSLVTIEPEAFNGCSSIDSTLYLPAIKTIRSRAFQGCTDLQHIYIGKSMFAADNQAQNCIGIEQHAFQFCDPGLNIYFCGNLDNISTWVGNHAHWGWYTEGDPAAEGNSYNYQHGGTEDIGASTIWETRAFEPDPTKVRIVGYTGAIPEAFISIPNKIGGKEVAEIDKDAFTTEVKNAIKRLYLPTTLLNICNNQFGPDYQQLTVIDDYNSCSADVGKDEALSSNGRIDLSGLTNLQFIGDVAFTNLGGGDNNAASIRDNIKSIHLPARLIAIGSSAFSIADYKADLRTQNRYKNVTDFQWDFVDDPDGTNPNGSRLEVIGGDAFMKFGSPHGDTNTNASALNNYSYVAHNRTTLIFPRTFKHFGITQDDVDRYSGETFKTEYKNNFTFNLYNTDDNPVLRTRDRPGHAFLGCPLLYKVIFKGSDNESLTEDLVIPVQTFVLCESLQTIIFEERKDHYITFHTQWANFKQQSIGASGGREAGKVDFRADPMVQTIVLPNADTYLRMQDMAFFGNARAAIYLTGEKPPANETLATAKGEDGSHIFGNKEGKHWPAQLREGFSDTKLGDVSHWNLIGDESRLNGGSHNGFMGYCFAESATANENTKTNEFGISQEIPCYDLIHYSAEIKNDAGTTITTVEVGDAANKRELIIENNCAFVCYDDNDPTKAVATMANYLYDLRDASIGEVTIPAKVQNKYKVTKIGASAFSACYADGADSTNLSDPTKDDYRVDLNSVVLPDTITHIEDYAFMRAYGVTKVSTSGKADYVMPSKLEYIGKMAFAFCSVQQVLKIPYDCVFYENTTAGGSNTKTVSVFTNALHLRHVTFLDERKNESNTSKFYEATQCSEVTITTPEDMSDPGESIEYENVEIDLTTAIYSLNTPNSGEYKSNKDKLLVILYRNDCKDKYSADYTSSGFNGGYKPNACLFGAYKMALWIDEIAFGALPNINPQPLFSAVCERTIDGAITHKPIYLDNAADKFYITIDTTKQGQVEKHACDLSTFTCSNVTVTAMPNYAFAGCENIEAVAFPTNSALIPDGLFSYNTYDGVKYYAVGDSDPAGNVVDLSNTAITSIGKEAFKENKHITSFIAPASMGSSAGLSIGASAFEGCTNLESIDFSNVACSKITIGASAFKNCKSLTSITFPSSADVEIVLSASEIFSGCKALTSIQLNPNTTGALGNSIFFGCEELRSVTVKGFDPEDADTAIKVESIGERAFSGCKNLNTFQFAAFSNVTKANKEAFKNTGSLGGSVSLPASWAEFGESAFSTTNMTSLTFGYAGENLKLGNSSFAENKQLTEVRFNKGCSLDNYNSSNIFKNSTALEKMFLPTDFELGTSKLSNFLLQDTYKKTPALCIYKKYKSYTGSLSDNWRKINGANYAQVYFQIQGDADADAISTSIDDVMKDNKSDVNATSTHYWATIGGVPTLLGTTPRRTTDPSLVIYFSTGYTLDSSGFHAPAP